MMEMRSAQGENEKLLHQQLSDLLRVLYSYSTVLPRRHNQPLWQSEHKAGAGADFTDDIELGIVMA